MNMRLPVATNCAPADWYDGELLFTNYKAPDEEAMKKMTPSQRLKALENEIMFGNSKWWGQWNVVCPNATCPEGPYKRKDPRVVEKVVGYPLEEPKDQWMFLCCACRTEWQQHYTKKTICSRILSLFGIKNKVVPEEVAIVHTIDDKLLMRVASKVEDWEKNPLLKKEE